ncbi:MAG: nucleotide exchange factor GrpE [Spirochaetaceae bacterium]
MTERPEDAAKRAQDPTAPEQGTDEPAGQQAGEEASKGPADGPGTSPITDSQEAPGDGAEGEEEDGGDPIQILTKRLSELEQENSELKDQFLRKSADFENFRKRINREKEEAIAFANRELLEDLLPIIDDFERAIKSAEESKDFDAFLEGVALIEKQFTSMLERKWGLTRFDSEGQEFDPQRHEAVTSQEGEPGSTPTVVEDYQKGYLLRDRVLRSAKVKVALPAETNA